MTASLNFLPSLAVTQTNRAKHQLTMQKRHLENVLKSFGANNKQAMQISWTYFNQPMKAQTHD